MSPIDLSGVAVEKYIYLTTIGRKTGNPHTVELWFAVVDDRIYLSHEGTYTDWMRNILRDSCVEFKIDGFQFKGQARIVQDEEVFNIGKNGLYLKYYGRASEDVIDDWFSESSVFEILKIKKK